MSLTTPRGRLTSGIWYHFTKAGEKAAKCRYCYRLIASSNGSTGNMKRHLKNIHPMVSYDRSATTDTGTAAASTGGAGEGSSAAASSTGGAGEGSSAAASRIKVGSGSSVPETNKPDVNEVNVHSRDEGGNCDTVPAPSSSSSIAPKNSCHSNKFSLMTKFVDVTRPISIHKSRLLDAQLLKMICKEYHPFSVVEDCEFKEFVRMLNPSYALPSRKTLTNSLLPTLYNESLLKVKEELKNAFAISLTSDGWTNTNNVSSYGLTAHFIDQRGSLKSYLLECSEFNEKHTGENIASWITKVLKSFDIDNKISAIVTDNASNMKSAASFLNIPHVSCFAHSLNLAVQNAIGKSIKVVVDKVKLIVQYFKKSSFALAKFTDMQKTLNKAPLKLKQDVPTRWNSTFDMLERIFLNKEPVVSTLALLDSKLSLESSDWEVIQHSVNVLKIFYDVTTEISAEQNVSLSKTCVMYRIMRQKMSKFSEAALPKSVSKLKKELEEGLQKRFDGREANELVSEAMLLDPRFKKQAFGDNEKFKLAYQSVVQKLKQVVIAEMDETSQVPSQKAKSVSSLWEEFDDSVMQIHGQQDPSSAATVELDKFLAEPHLARVDDPLQWWDARKAVYPNLYDLMRKRLCVPATSVPCERLFSKAGQISTDKRSRLSAKHIEKILFLYSNA